MAAPSFLCWGLRSFPTNRSISSQSVARRVLPKAVAGLAGVLALGMAGASAEREGDRLVKARLVAEQSAIVPGAETAIGVTLAIEPGWHVYWRNNGDTGMPVSVSFASVPGVTIGEVQWPSPMRHVSDGELLDYIHEREVTLIFPVKIEAGMTPGTAIELAAKVDWLVCKDLCLPGAAEVKLSLPIATSASAGKDAALFAAARKSHARAPRAGEASWSWEASTLVVRVAGASALVFFPYESDDGVTPSDMIHSGETRGEVIRLEYPGEVSKGSRVRGVLEVRRGDQKEFLLVDTEGPGPR